MTALIRLYEGAIKALGPTHTLLPRLFAALNRALIEP